jgi:hypothetical protein
MGFGQYVPYGTTGQLSQEQTHTEPFSAKFFGSDAQLIEQFGEAYSFGFLANTYYTLTLWIYSDVADQQVRTEFLEFAPGQFALEDSFIDTVDTDISKGDRYNKYFDMQFTDGGTWKRYTHNFYTLHTLPNVRLNIGTFGAIHGPVYIADIVLTVGPFDADATKM